MTPPVDGVNGSFAWITDTHMLDTVKWSGKDSNVVAANIAGRSPDFVISTGDITNDNQAIQYAAFNDFLGRIGQERYYVIPGNHECSNATVTLFDTYRTARRFVVERFGITFIGFYTWQQVNPGEINGALQADELAWIEQQMIAADGGEVILCSHFPIYSGWGENEMTDGSAELQTLMQTYNVIGYLSGNVHGNGETTIDGIKHISLTVTPNAYAIGEITAEAVTIKIYDYSNALVQTYTINRGA